LKATRRLTLTVAMALTAVGLSAAPVAADCQGGPVWPGSVAEAQGETFVGVFLRSTSDASGDETFHWDVEQVYAGAIRPGAQTWGTGRPSCHPTHYTEGVRYLVSGPPKTQPGSRDAFSVVAYRLLDRDRLQMHPFEGEVADYPAELQVDTLSDALAVLVPDALPPTDTDLSAASPLSAAILLIAGLLGAIIARPFATRPGRRGARSAVRPGVMTVAIR